jgi:DNA-directed RNA polymerase specialized sigma24 family protein
MVMIDSRLVEAYEKHSADLMAYATTLVGAQRAEDVVADAMVRVFLTADWSRIDDARPYFFRCVLNECRRQSKRAALCEVRERLQASRGVAPDVDPGSEPDPDVDVDPELRRALAQLIGQSPPAPSAEWLLHRVSATASPPRVGRALGAGAGAAAVAALVTAALAVGGGEQIDTNAGAHGDLSGFDADGDGSPDLALGQPVVLDLPAGDRGCLSPVATLGGPAQRQHRWPGRAATGHGTAAGRVGVAGHDQHRRSPAVERLAPWDPGRLRRFWRHRPGCGVTASIRTSERLNTVAWDGTAFVAGGLRPDPGIDPTEPATAGGDSQLTLWRSEDGATWTGPEIPALDPDLRTSDGVGHLVAGTDGTVLSTTLAQSWSAHMDLAGTVVTVSAPEGTTTTRLLPEWLIGCAIATDWGFLTAAQATSNPADTRFLASTDGLAWVDLGPAPGMMDGGVPLQGGLVLRSQRSGGQERNWYFPPIDDTAASWSPGATINPPPDEPIDPSGDDASVVSTTVSAYEPPVTETGASTTGG